MSGEPGEFDGPLGHIRGATVIPLGELGEGSGAARAALFNGIGSLEIRAVTDVADKETPRRFDENLPMAMSNLASLLRLWLEWSRNHSEHLLRGSWR